MAVLCLAHTVIFGVTRLYVFASVDRNAQLRHHGFLRFWRGRLSVLDGSVGILSSVQRSTNDLPVLCSDRPAEHGSAPSGAGYPLLPRAVPHVPLRLLHRDRQLPLPLHGERPQVAQLQVRHRHDRLSAFVQRDPRRWRSRFGVTPEDQLLLRPVLEVVRQWMELPRNRDEILILYLDTSVNLIRWKKVEELVSIFQSVFGSLIIPPQPDLDFRRLLVQKKRLMIVSRRVYPGADSVFFSMDSAFTCQYPLFLVESSFTHLERAGHRKGLSQRRNGSERQSLVGREIASVRVLLARGDEPTALRPAEQGLSPLSVAREHLRQKHARFVRARFQYAGCGLHRREVGRQPHLDMVARPRSMRWERLRGRWRRFATG